MCAANMAAYKMVYFPVEAKGELIRFIFAQAGVEYQQELVTRASWPALKPKTQFGYIPILEFDGNSLSGSGPIARYLAEKHGLAGSNEIENAKIAAIKDFQDEVVQKMGKAFWTKPDEASKKELDEQVVKEHIPRYLGTLEKIIKENLAGNGWLFGSKVTYVDLNLYLIVDFMKLFQEDIFANGSYAEVEKLTKAVAALPKIAEWLQKRPERTYGPPVA